MDEHNIRAAIDRHWAASAAGDQVGEHEIYHDDVVCEYPQSGEIIYGRRNLQALRSHHPDRPSEFSVRRIVGEGNLWVSEYVINYGGQRIFTVSVMEFRDGKVSHETQYFADSFDAPTWRAQWVARAVIRPDIPERLDRSDSNAKSSNNALWRGRRAAGSKATLHNSRTDGSARIAALFFQALHC